MDDSQSVDFVVPGFLKDHRVDYFLPSLQCVIVSNTIIDDRDNRIDYEGLLFGVGDGVIVGVLLVDFCQKRFVPSEVTT